MNFKQIDIGGDIFGLNVLKPAPQHIDIRRQSSLVAVLFSMYDNKSSEETTTTKTTATTKTNTAPSTTQNRNKNDDDDDGGDDNDKEEKFQPKSGKTK